MPFVLDASIALSWYLPGQGNSHAEAVYRRLNTGGELYRLAKRYNLSVYDVHYFELARRLEAPLATADHGLRAAARRHRVPLYQP